MESASSQHKQETSHQPGLMNVQCEEFKPSAKAKQAPLSTLIASSLGSFSLDAKEFVPHQQLPSPDHQAENGQHPQSKAEIQHQIDQGSKVQKLLVIIDGMLEVKSIKQSNSLISTIDEKDLSLRFESIYSDYRVQGYFRSLGIQHDFIACQALMSSALAKMKNARPDFVQQRAFLHEVKGQQIAIRVNPKDILEEVLRTLVHNGYSCSKKGQSDLIVHTRRVPEESSIKMMTILDELYKDKYTLTHLEEDHEDSLEGLRKFIRDRKHKHVMFKEPKVMHEPHQAQRLRLYSEQIDNNSMSFQAKQFGYSKKFIQYSTEDILKVFNESLEVLPQQMPESLKKMFSEELQRNVFNDQRRTELSINEEDIVRRSDRGLSMTENGIVFVDPSLTQDQQEEFMRLKRTTVLTGNHGQVKQRNRAQSENEIFTSQFKGLAALNGQEQAKTQQQDTQQLKVAPQQQKPIIQNNSAPTKKYVPKNSLHPQTSETSTSQSSHQQPYQVAYRKKSHAV